MKHVMLDLETLSTETNAVIVSISAVEFDLVTGDVGKTFEKFLNILQQAIQGGDICKDTLAWWTKQSNAAKSALLAKSQLDVEDVLEDFNGWLESLDYEPKKLNLWGNGVSFDNLLLRELYKRHNIDFVCPYWCDNDVRTLVTIGNIDTRNFKFTGVKHNGIDDCKHQISYCVAAYKGLS